MRRTLTTLLVVLAATVACKKTATQFSEVPVEDPNLIPRTTVDALIFGSRVFPVSQFRNVTGAECDGDAHWHSDGKIAPIGTLNADPTGTMIFVCLAPAEEPADATPFPVDCREDPAPGDCGHGKVSQVTRQQVQLFQDCVDAYPRTVCR